MEGRQRDPLMPRAEVCQARRAQGAHLGHPPAPGISLVWAFNVLRPGPVRDHGSLVSPVQAPRCCSLDHSSGALFLSEHVS